MTATARVQLEPAFILHQRPYRESSALLDVFSEAHGRVGLVARGVRSARSKQRGELQPFRPLRLSWSGRGELGTLTGVEADGSLPPLHGEALYSAFYLNELLVRLLARQDPHRELFGFYRDSLRQLSAGAGIEAVLRLFEKRLLEEIGYGMLLDHDLQHDAPVQPQGWYDYHLESGPVAVSGADAAGFVFAGSSLLALQRGELDDAQALADAKRLMRSALRLYLGDKPLKSRELFRALKAPR